MKPFAKPAVAAALAALLHRDGMRRGGETAPAARVRQPLRMTIWTANEAHLKLFNEIAADYRKTHPDVSEITFDPLPFESYTTTLTTQIAGGNAPDLAWILESSAPDFVSSGALAPLDDTLRKARGLRLRRPHPSARASSGQSEGKLYAYPFSTSPFGVFVNTDLLKEAGQKTPPR